MFNCDLVQNLKALAELINSTNKAIRSYGPPKGLFEIKWDESVCQKVDRMNSILKSKLLENIILTPLLASYQVRDQNQYDERTKTFWKNNNSLIPYLKLVGNINLAIFKPVKSIWNIGQNVTELKRIQKICGYI